MKEGANVHRQPTGPTGKSALLLLMTMIKVPASARICAQSPTTCRLRGPFNESHPALVSHICPVISQVCPCSIWESYRLIRRSLLWIIMGSCNSCLQDLLTSVLASLQPTVPTEIVAILPKHKSCQLIPCSELFRVPRLVSREHSLQDPP